MPLVCYNLLKPRLNVNDLVVDKVYRVVKFRRINTKYSVAIIVDLDLGTLFLSKRYTEIIREDNIEGFSKRSLGLVFKKLQPTPQGRATPPYEIIEME